MAISWGAWQDGSGNGMRVGIEVIMASVSHSSATAQFTVKIYTQNRSGYSDSQTLNYSDDITGSKTFTNNVGSGTILRDTLTDSYTYGAGEFGTSPGDRTYTATMSGVPGGITPSKSVTIAIPARPIDVPAKQTDVLAVRTDDTTAHISWTINPTAGEPYDSQEMSHWDNVSNAWTMYSADMDSTVTAKDRTIAANRRYRFKVRARNSAGASAWGYADFIQTTPAAPTGATVTRSAVFGSVIISWDNGASTLNGYSFTTLIEEQVNGGTWTEIATVDSGTKNYRTNVDPASNYKFRVRHRSTVGDTTYSSYSTTSTLDLLPDVLAPTGLTLTRTNDNSFTLGWTNAGSYSLVEIQRWDEASDVWGTIGTVPGTATTFTDTTTSVNAAYQWRIRAVQTADRQFTTYSTWVTTSAFQTRPAEPTDVKAKVVPGGSILLTWTNAEGYAAYTTGIRYYQDGVLVNDTISAAAGVTSYTLTGVSTSSIYKFGVRAKSTVGYTSQSEWVDTADVAGSTPPNAPANLAPSGIALDLDNDQEFTWTHSPAADGADQSAFDVRYSTDGGATWTTPATVTSAVSSWTLVAGTIANGQEITWQVRTYGVDPTPSDWSSSAVFDSSAIPTVTIMSPGVDEVLTTSVIHVEWSYSDAEATPQAGWAVELYDGSGNLLEQQNADGTDTGLDLTTVSVDGASYKVRVQVEDGTGLFSEWAEQNFTTSFTPPAEPTFSADYDSSSGTAIITLTPTADVPPGTVHVTNYFPNPSAEGGSSGWAAVAGSDVPAISNEQAWIGGKSFKAARGAGTSTLFGSRNLGTILPAVSGTYRVTVRVWVPAFITGNAGIRISGTGVDGIYDLYTATRDGWAELSETITFTAGGTAFLYFKDNAITPGAFAYMDGIIVSDGIAYADYFDGDTEDGDGFTYSWSGTPYASSSVKTSTGSLPASGVDVQRRLYQPETDTWGDWETLIEGAAPDATLIDTTAPIAGDGEYRLITHSTAPSSRTSASRAVNGSDDRWVYLSGGPHFHQVCRLMGNVALRSTTSRDRALYNFAGRKKPVMFAGEARERVIDVAGLLDGESSSPAEWESLIESGDVLLFRDPLGHRMYGSVSQVAIDYLGNNLYAIAFTVTEVDYP
jgi:hypothetical protein